MKVAVLGGGAVAQALWRELPKPVLRWRRPQKLPDLAGVDIVLLAVSDDAIAALAAELPIGRGQLVAHLAGALGLAPLRPLLERGARIGSIHPLRAFVRGERATFEGAAAGITASDSKARSQLTRLARSLGMNPLHVRDEARPLYHAAAVLSAGAEVALFSEAVRAFRKATGVTEPVARAALLPLTLNALGKLADAPAAEVVTGSAVRGDAGTVRAHRERLPRDLLPLYDALTRVMVQLSRDLNRADPGRLRAVLRALDRQK